MNASSESPAEHGPLRTVDSPKSATLLGGLVAAVIRLSLVAIAVGIFAAGDSYPRELLVHTRAHLLVATGVLFALAAWRSLRLTAAFAGILAAVLFVSIKPWRIWIPAAQPTVPVSAAEQSMSLSVMYWNALTSNSHADAILPVIDQFQPDVLFVLEYSPRVAAALSRLPAEYHQIAGFAREDAYGIAAFSRVNAVAKPVNLPGEIIALRVDLPSQNPSDDAPTATLWGVHTMSPVSSRNQSTRDAQLQQLSLECNDANRPPTIVGGDWNITPWSTACKKFLVDAHLRQCRDGFGFNATWPQPLQRLGIPIDHVACSSQVAVEEFRAIDVDAGSDHAPIFARLKIPIGPAQPERP